ncbi:hypothetical protein [Xanthomonas cucurbitae]|uniref:Uncharacterized protein n=1 Tax=Xanthomonas cucurbitae TaxID=56453 RepID=A0ABY7YD47_9XANT|nr:hypothetical protein [Xanthomonas cucurbitae]WDM67920.1 hypothetical protein K6981_00855 [Xanthomonas cucurbitae]WDM71794.1 hypothetical protein K6978_00850 [Xanthomonas cucurbitae]
MAASTAATNGHAVAVEVGGVRYPSARRAAQAIGLSTTAVNNRCHSDKWPDYVWLGAAPGARAVHDPADVKIARPLIEPERWPNDGGARRAPVMDPNFDPPKVVRRVGWLRCMCCCRFHFSEDVARARMCVECGGAGGWPVGARDEDALT